MTSHEGKEVTSSVQCCVVNECHCRKASMTGHEGKKVTGSVQCYVVNKCHYVTASITGREGKRGYRLRAIFHCK